MKLLLFTPVFCAEPRHLGMIRVQSLLAERLRRHLDCEIVSAVVVDFCREDLKAELHRIVAPFDIVRHSDAAPHGIRRPTNYAMDTLVPETDTTRMLRVIQDTFVDDVVAFSRSIEAALPETGHWVAAGVEHGERDGHQSWCEEIGVPFRRELEFPQGCLMLAPAETWREMYLQGLPESITHLWDDVMMGELLRHRGGRLIELPRSWSHRHGCGLHWRGRSTQNTRPNSALGHASRPVQRRMVPDCLKPIWPRNKPGMAASAVRTRTRGSTRGTTRGTTRGKRNCPQVAAPACLPREPFPSSTRGH
jgi:hypothetical protein